MALVQGPYVVIRLDDRGGLWRETADVGGPGGGSGVGEASLSGGMNKRGGGSAWRSREHRGSDRGSEGGVSMFGKHGS